MESDEERFHSVEEEPYNGFKTFQYTDPFLVSGILRSVVMEDLEEIKHLIACGHSVNINDNNGNTPLHVAVIKKNLSIVNVLLAEEHIAINHRNFYGQTPLLIAVKSGSFELAQCLVKNGANVNLPNYDDVTPLHLSVEFPNIAQLLITNGAEIDALDFRDDTPLHDAVDYCYLESVYMLLFYNADANIQGDMKSTPFMNALIRQDYALQEALFEYVNDFNVLAIDGISTLDLALTHDNIFVEEMINRGAKVDSLSYLNCLRVPNHENFKIVWNKLPLEEAKYVTLVELVEMLDENHFCYYMDVIMEDSDPLILSEIAENMKSCDMALIVDKYSKCKCALDKLTKFIFIMLQHGYEMDSLVIDTIFSKYEYCELIKLLLFIDYVSEWSPLMITTRLIFDVESGMKMVCHEVMSAHNFSSNLSLLRENIISSFSYWVYPPLVELYNTMKHVEFRNSDEDKFSHIVENLPKMPSLLELARDKTRGHIVERLKITTTCQYYTVINHLDISTIFKKILMFETKIYHY
ncbi:uncharacterized protein isoform X1 [Leptinotarsa decemlineata]|uniref:uncharacterized protein isoform X1 n=2 Tax=Leptinotarsa decemlineata TaxID=7539 RepID=UPI003D304C0B